MGVTDMKLFYSPSYSGFVYTDSSRLMFNERLVDTAALVEEIKLHAGLSTARKEDIERTVDYYKAMKIYMEKNPNNVLKASFDVDGLSVAKECLTWRDTLTFAGWNNTKKAPSKRIEVLSGVEAYFEDISLGEELKAVTEAVRNGCQLPENLEIETLIDWKLFSPLESELIEALQARGVTVSIKELPSKADTSLSSIIDVLESSSDKEETIKKDGTFNILHFEEQDEALKYLSLQKPYSYDVWINSDNKAFDDWLYLEGKATSGSRIKGGLPQITQLLPIGLGTLASPMSLKNMVEWLNVPLSPLKSTLRNKIEARIAREGGYYNDKVKKIIDSYINCDNEFTDLSEDERAKKVKEESKKRAEKIEKFLPDINNAENSTDGSVSRNKAYSFTKALYDWCGTELTLLSDDMQKAQIALVKNECTAVLNMLETESDERMPFTKLMAFVSDLKAGVDMLQYEAEESCRTVISNPGQLAASAKSLIWCDFYNDAKETLKYDFLLPAEKAEFRKTLLLWGEDTEREYNHQIKMLPFYLADKVTLVVIDKKVTEDVETHPLYIQIKQRIKNLEDFVLSPDVNSDFKTLLQNPVNIDNGIEGEAEGITIQNAKLIQWPDHETYSSLEQIVYNPFDYAFGYLAGISALGNSSLPKVYQAYGTCAHAVIETLFNKKEGIEDSGTVPYIKENIKNKFDKVFTDMVNGCGAVLLLKENLLNLPNYKAKVFDCVNALVKVLEDNKLHVLACEPWLENTQMGFEGGIKIGGYADMILADEQNNPVVFDFKWYPGKVDKFKKTIEENKSIQLELYKYLTKELAGSEAKAVAYVVIPEVTLVSAQTCAGNNTVKVTVKDADEQLLPKLKNSYKYRRSQIENGFIEEATGFAPDAITYQNDCDTKNLIPLEFDGKREPKKQPKPYPQYEFFKERK